jgi:hypothetical protein
MKSCIYLWGVMLALLAHTGYAQQTSLYYKAIYLEAQRSAVTHKIPLDEPTKDVLRELYAPNTAITVALLDANPLLKDQFEDAPGSGVSALRQPLAAVGGLNVTNLADGLAKFLIKRSKEELSVAFFQGFKDDLKKYPELKVLFPNTASFIENIEAYNYASFLQTLREGFQADLMSLPTGLRNLRTLTPGMCLDGNKKCTERLAAIENFFEKNELSILYVASTIVMDSLQAGANIADILHAIAEDEQTDKFQDVSNISNAVLLADIFSSSLRSKDADRVWVTRTELKELKNANRLKLFFGMILQKCVLEDIRFTINGNNVSFASLIKAEDAQRYYTYLETIVSAGTEVNQVVKDIRTKKAADEKFTSDNYVQYLNASVDAVQLLVNWEPFKITIPPAQLQNMTTILRSAISVYYNIRAENYASAISNVFIIVDHTLSNSYEHKEKILRYGAFMASIVQAESADQVAEAIEAVALPAGSASIKKSADWNISLNAYLGGFTGREYLAEKTTDRWGTTRGIAAPVGIAVSRRVYTASVTAFVSVIDIGAVASYRLDDNNTADLPELKLQNIFAPGAGLVIGLPRWPVSIGYLWQAGPALREISGGAATISSSTNRRQYIFVGVDIPLLNFYTKPRNK